MILIDTIDTVVNVLIIVAMLLIAGAGVMVLIGIVGLIRHLLRKKNNND